MKNELWTELNEILSDETIREEHKELSETVSLIVKQIELGKDKIEDTLPYLIDNMNVKVLSYKGNVFGVEPPTFVELEVTYTEPGFAGNNKNNDNEVINIKKHKNKNRNQEIQRIIDEKNNFEIFSEQNSEKEIYIKSCNRKR